MTNFACRIAKSGRGGGQGVDIISILKEYAGRVTGLREAMGDDFARGHKEVSVSWEKDDTVLTFLSGKRRYRSHGEV